MTADPVKGDSGGGSARKRAPLVFAALALALLLLLLPLWPALTVTDFRTQRTLALLPIRRDETFSIRFTHSLNLSDVTDNIQWDGTLLYCRSTLFFTYGAGIPDLPDGIGTDFSVTEEGFLLSGIDKPETSIPIMLQQVPNHRLLYRGGSYSLLQRYGSGRSVVLSVTSRPALLILWKSIPFLIQGDSDIVIQ